MAFGNQTFADAGGAVSDLFQANAKSDQLKLSATGLRLNATGLRLKATGDQVESQNYDLASTLATKNEQFTEQSVAIQQMQADRQIALGIGQERAAIAGSGGTESGSALDILRSSAQQGALQKQVLGQQGLITEAGYKEQAQSYTNLSGYAKISEATNEQMAGITDQMADKTDQMAKEAITAGQISAGIKSAAAIATLFV